MSDVKVNKYDEQNNITNSELLWKNILLSTNFKPESFQYFVKRPVSQTETTSFEITNIGTSVFTNDLTETTSLISTLTDANDVIINNDVEWFIETANGIEELSGVSIELKSQDYQNSSQIKIYAETVYKSKKIKSNVLLINKVDTTEVVEEELDFTIVPFGSTSFLNETEEEFTKIVAYLRDSNGYIINNNFDWYLDYSKQGKNPIYVNRLFIQIFASDLLKEESVKVYAKTVVNGKTIKSNEIVLVRAVGGVSNTTPVDDDTTIDTNVRFNMRLLSGLNNVVLTSMNNPHQTFISNEFHLEVFNVATNDKVLPIDGKPFTFIVPNSLYYVDQKVMNPNSIYFLVKETDVDTETPLVYDGKKYEVVDKLQADEKNEVRFRFVFHKLPPTDFTIPISLQEVPEYNFITNVTVPKPEQFTYVLEPAITIAKSENANRGYYYTNQFKIKLLNENGSKIIPDVLNPVKLKFTNINYFVQDIDENGTPITRPVNDGRVYLGEIPQPQDISYETFLLEARGLPPVIFSNAVETILNTNGDAFLIFIISGTPESEIVVKFNVERGNGYYKKEYNIVLKPSTNSDENSSGGNSDENSSGGNSDGNSSGGNVNLNVNEIDTTI